MRTKEEIKAELDLLGQQRADIQRKFELAKQELADCLSALHKNSTGLYSGSITAKEQS